MKNCLLLWPAPARSATWRSSPAPRRRCPPSVEPSGLPAFSKGPNEPFFAAAESVYDKVKDGEKIFASTKAEVGVLRYARKRARLRPAPASFATFGRGWCGGAAPSFQSSAARSRIGRSAAGRGKATPTTAAIRVPTALSGAGSSRTAPATSTFCSINPSDEIRRHSHWTVFSIGATTGIWSTWPESRGMSAREL
jgi:hypothetical protein